jgi:lipopolysaccharide biosynthesis glycosyltransferase
MKRAIVTRADSGVDEWIRLTHPIMRKYAEKCKADFVVMSGPAPFVVSHHSGRPAHYYRVLRIRDLLECYDRILHLDTDMIINKDCPDIFEVVPEDMIGGVREDVGTRQLDRLQQIKYIQHRLGDIGWKDKYINEGTFLVSRQHKDIFLPHRGKYWTGWAGSQSHMSYNIHKFNFNIYDLGYKWNHMTMFSETWNNNADRFKSNIIHYAGNGIFDKRVVKTKFNQAKKDCEVIYGAFDPRIKENMK